MGLWKETERTKIQVGEITLLCVTPAASEDGRCFPIRASRSLPACIAWQELLTGREETEDPTAMHGGWEEGEGEEAEERGDGMPLP